MDFNIGAAVLGGIVGTITITWDWSKTTVVISVEVA